VLATLPGNRARGFMRIYKLDQQTAATIREKGLKKTPISDLAIAYGVSLPTIRSIIRYDRYLPTLSKDQQKELERLSNKFGCTRDHALNMIFSRGAKIVEEMDI
jgi:hypothetical protein